MYCVIILIINLCVKLYPLSAKNFGTLNFQKSLDSATDFQKIENFIPLFKQLISIKFMIFI